MMEKVKKRWPVTTVSVVLFAVYAIVLLATVYGNYMRKIEALTLWMPTAMYFDECMTVPGGLVKWLSAYLTQTMYYPWLGASVFAMMLAALQLVAIKAFDVPKGWRTATVLLPALVLLGFTRLGYLIFTLRPVGYAFSVGIGTLCCLLGVWLMRVCRRWWLRSLVAVTIVTAGYGYFGFYALLAAAIGAISCVNRKEPLQWVTVAVAAVMITVVPQLWYRYIGGELMHTQMYVSGLPQYYANELSMRAVCIALPAVMLIFAVLPLGRMLKPKMQIYTALGIWVVSVAGVQLLRYHDSNFFATLDMDRAIWCQDWPTAIAVAEKLTAEPTRLNTLLADVAVMRNGDAANRLFEMPYGWAKYNTSRDTRPLLDADGALLSYHLGLVNYAYRWGMEYSIAQCMGPERLKILAKCALLNFEPQLAKTYLEILYNMPFHREWAKKYLRYVANPLEMSNDAELTAIKQLMCHPNEFVNDHGDFETYVWPLLTQEEAATPQFNELSMQSALISRDLDAFMQKLPLYLPVGGRYPRYYQEAALLWSLLGKQPCPIPIDPATKQRHEMFLNAFRATSGMVPEEQREMMRNDFKDTYWFYFVFNNH